MTGPNDSYAVGAVANFMIGRARNHKRRLTHPRLQNLVYVAYGIHLASSDSGDSRLFEERIEAGPDGPLVPALYHEFKRFGLRPIRGWASDFDYETRKVVYPVVEDDDKLALHALNLTWSLYGNRPPAVLTKLTKRPGGPWEKAVSTHRSEIPDTWIREQFDAVLNEVVERVLTGGVGDS